MVVQELSQLEISMSTLITPFQTVKEIVIKTVDTPEAAKKLQKKGYTPVEASFGSECVVDDLKLDHHGPFSDLEGVAIRAYRDHFGSRRDNPKFVTTGFPDEDATWAMCSLAGIIPHPSMADLFPNAPRAMKVIARQNFLHVAEKINEVDLDPNLASTLEDTFWGRQILSWRQQAHPTATDTLAWYGGVNRWRAIMTAQSEEFANVAPAAQHEQMETVMSAHSVNVSDEVVVVDFSNLGRNSNYYKMWNEKYPILVAYIGGPNGKGTCSFVARDIETIETLLGKGGFIPHYAELSPGGCNGRPNIGGSSRQIMVTWDHAIAYGKAFAELVASHTLVANG